MARITDKSLLITYLLKRINFLLNDRSLAAADVNAIEYSVTRTELCDALIAELNALLGIAKSI